MKSKPILKPKHIAKKSIKRTDKKVLIQSIKKKRKDAYKKWKKIDFIKLNRHHIQALKQQQNSNDLNRLAYKYAIHKDSYITIVTTDKQLAKIIKKYLLHHGIPSQDIKTHIKRTHETRIILTGRK